MTKANRKKRFRFQSIFVRYSVSLLGILLISFILLVIVSSVFINIYYTDLRRDEMSRILQSSEKAISRQYDYYLEEKDEKPFLRSDNLPLLRSLASLTDDYAHFFFVTDGTGTICCVDISAPKLLNGRPSDGYFPISEASEDHRGRGDLGIFEDEQYYDAMNVTYQGEYIATVYICVPVKVVKEPINTIIGVLSIVAIGVMLTALLIAYFISRRITDPLAKMALAAKAFAAGDFSVRVDVTGEDEVSEFGRVFNEMAQSLENLDKTRNDFVANVSHDLRSPMTSISGFLEGMLSGVIPSEKHGHYLSIVLAETKRLSRLVTVLLDISRIQAGERKFKPVNFNLAELARQIIISLESRITEKKLELTFHSDKDRLYAYADMDAIYQVLYNLCDNAVKFSSVGGRMALTILERDDKLAVSIYNEGEGIPSEDLPFVFDRFYKADKSRGIDKTGTGLGLYISKKIMEAHGETVTVESEYQKDCRFTFTLKKGTGKDRPTVK